MSILERVASAILQLSLVNGLDLLSWFLCRFLGSFCGLFSGNSWGVSSWSFSSLCRLRLAGRLDWFGLCGLSSWSSNWLSGGNWLLFFGHFDDVLMKEVKTKRA
jgi:hypothetical protein